MRKYKFKHHLDSPERTLIHQEIIKNKAFLRKLYLKWYSYFVNDIREIPEGQIVELGSGGGFFKEIEPRVICSDVLDLPANDMCFSALEMPFQNNSVSGIFMIDTMHHIPDAELFLHEVQRVLKKNGKMMMIEPSNSLWGRFVYKNFHHEPFNPKGNWQIPSSGPLSGANGALPWIVFERDKAIFNSKFPDLAIERIQYINPLLYLISGGVSRHQMLPDFCYPLVNWFDAFLPRISKHFSMFVLIKIKKI